MDDLVLPNDDDLVPDVDAPAVLDDVDNAPFVDAAVVPVAVSVDVLSRAIGTGDLGLGPPPWWVPG